jgi:hypothetical protein
MTNHLRELVEFAYHEIFDFAVLLRYVGTLVIVVVVVPRFRCTFVHLRRTLVHLRGTSVFGIHATLGIGDAAFERLLVDSGRLGVLGWRIESFGTTAATALWLIDAVAFGRLIDSF